MAKYRPQSEIVIAEPCNESWEQMHGDSRVRHCAACDRQVHNLASMTPSQIEALLAHPEMLPCMRIARFADGSLLVADEQRSRLPYGAVAGAAMAGVLALSAGVAGAQQNTIGRIGSVRNAVYSGRVVDPFGNGVSGAKVVLTRIFDGNTQTLQVETNSKGEFDASVQPGEWQLRATAKDGTSGATAGPLHLHGGSQRAEQPITLQPITITAGVPMIAPPDRPLKQPTK